MNRIIYLPVHKHVPIHQLSSMSVVLEKVLQQTQKTSEPATDHKPVKSKL